MALGLASVISVASLRDLALGHALSPRCYYSHTSCEVLIAILSHALSPRCYYPHTCCEVLIAILSHALSPRFFYSHTCCEVLIAILSHALSPRFFYSHTGCPIDLSLLILCLLDSNNRLCQEWCMWLLTASPYSLYHNTH